MFESSEHHNLVMKGAEYIEAKHPELDSITIDDYNKLGEGKLLYFLNYQPDIVGESRNVIVIGEAKTENDILKKHSLGQYEELLNCTKFYNQRIYYYIFVPWKVKPALHNYLKNFCKKNELDDVIWKVVSEVELL